MITCAFGVILLCMVVTVVLLLKSKEAFSRVLLLGVLASFIVAAIALYAVYTAQELYLDVAIILAMLGFMDVQFYAVYLRRKGDL